MPVCDNSRPPIRTIAVTGDIALDHYEIAFPPDKVQFNWQFYPYINHQLMPGGALLLKQFLGQTAGRPISAPELADIQGSSARELVHSFSRLQKMPFTAERNPGRPPVYRIAENAGYAGPLNQPSTLPLDDGDESFDMVVLDDAGNGFRDDPNRWPRCISESGQPLVILKMNAPLAEGRLWKELQQKHAHRLVVIINADHLRREGINISRRLSWERTALDFMRQMAGHSKLAELGRAAALIVRIGLDGAILYSRCQQGIKARLFYDPNLGEDEFQARHPGLMSGAGSAFAAAVAVCAAAHGLEDLGEGIRQGIIYQRRLWKYGFRYEAGRLEYPLQEIFSPSCPDDAFIAEVDIPRGDADDAKGASYWSILTEQEQSSIEELAFEYVRAGPGHTMTAVPAGQFGDLITYDRSEIESYRSIANLITEYLDLKTAKKPLSVAVFGAPGSGKSFGVTEIAESVAPGRTKRLEFNLSEFAAEKDLINAFHIVRDVVLSGMTPLVFFDEFDCSLNGQPLGWLKHFLAPMQNGRFRDGETLHPLGKSIFVFAGGIFHCLEDFSRFQNVSAPSHSAYDFKTAKIPDFISRLRGFANIKGPNAAPGETNDLFMIRRALNLRALLKKSASQLFTQDDQLRIDEGVLRAMIKTGEFKHGARSIAAIIDMSMLSGRRSFEQAALPSLEQLELHVDAATFCRLMERDMLLAEANETMARGLHEFYCKMQKGSSSASAAVLVPWELLEEGFKESNRQQAAHIMEKVRAAGYGITAVAGRTTREFEFTGEEIELMAEMEHQRWNAERLLAGWRWAAEKDVDNKLSPYIVPWSDLPDEIREYDRQLVRTVPAILAASGFEIYKMK